jgi:hypothetical protein
MIPLAVSGRAADADIREEEIDVSEYGDFADVHGKLARYSLRQ